jgi:hypothetical protein
MVRRNTIFAGLVIYGMVISPAFAGTWRDDFEDGNLDGWQREEPPMGGEIWGVEDGECSGQYANAPAGICSAIQLKAENAALWKDYSVECKAKLVEKLGEGASFGIFFRDSLFQSGAQNDYVASVAPDQNKVFFYEVSQNKGRTISEVPLPFDISEDTWYKLKVIAEGNHFGFYINDELIGSFDDNSCPSGTISLAVRNAHIHFDDVVITGQEIPDGGPGFAVTSQSKMATMWGRVKRDI